MEEPNRTQPIAAEAERYHYRPRAMFADENGFERIILKELQAIKSQNVQLANAVKKVDKGK